MCGLPPRAGQAGAGFVPQLNDPGCKRAPSVTANEKGFSVRTVRWRYIAYHDGSEELYDHDKDPMEWDNLAPKPDFAEVKRTLKAFVPQHPAPARTAAKEPDAKGRKEKPQPVKTAGLDPYTAIP